MKHEKSPLNIKYLRGFYLFKLKNAFKTFLIFFVFLWYFIWYRPKTD
nr:MAG TPA: hypothetical protein [Caudoviricetes sp.]